MIKGFSMRENQAILDVEVHVSGGDFIRLNILDDKGHVYSGDTYKDGTLQFGLKPRRGEQGMTVLEGTVTMTNVKEVPKRLTLMVTSIRTGYRDVKWKWEIPASDRP